MPGHSTNDDCIGKSIDVYWSDDDEWMSGVVTDTDGDYVSFPFDQKPSEIGAMCATIAPATWCNVTIMTYMVVV